MLKHASISTVCRAVHKKMIVLTYPITSLEIDPLKGKSRSKHTISHKMQLQLRKTKAFSIRNALLTQRKVSNGVSPLCALPGTCPCGRPENEEKSLQLCGGGCGRKAEQRLGLNTRETRARPPSENAVRHLLVTSLFHRFHGAPAKSW